MLKFSVVFLSFVVLMFMSNANAHSGRTDKSGCHNDRSSGTRHCH